MNDSKVKNRTLISIRNLGVKLSLRKSIFRKQEHWPLRNVSFDLHSGESLAIIGRNGAGKSTLIKILAGVLSPDEGEVTRPGSVTVSTLALKSGMDPDLSGRENIILQGILMGHSRQEMEVLFDEIHEFSELGNAINNAVRTYSAGMRARLGFSISYFMKTDVLLIDEALGVGDAEFRKKSTDAMRGKINSDQTVVFVSHNGDVVKSVCDRAVWIEKGQLQMVGGVDEVVDAYEAYAKKVRGSVA